MATGSGSRGTTHGISTRHTQPGATPAVLNIHSQVASTGGPGGQTYTLDDIRTKPERDVVYEDDKSSVNNGKEGSIPGANDDYSEQRSQNNGIGVKITIDREVDYQARP